MANKDKIIKLINVRGMDGFTVEDDHPKKGKKRLAKQERLALTPAPKTAPLSALKRTVMPVRRPLADGV